jgi:hypothetical protein
MLGIHTMTDALDINLAAWALLVERDAEAMRNAKSETDGVATPEY